MSDANKLAISVSEAAEILGLSVPIRMDEAYGAMEYINKPLYELPKYFPRYEV